MSDVLSSAIEGYVKRGEYKPRSPWALDPPDDDEIRNLGGAVVIALSREDLRTIGHGIARPRDLLALVRAYLADVLFEEGHGDGFQVTKWALFLRRAGGRLVATFTPRDAR